MLTLSKWKPGKDKKVGWPKISMGISCYKGCKKKQKDMKYKIFHSVA